MDANYAIENEGKPAGNAGSAGNAGKRDAVEAVGAPSGL
jgi:hypothetical protein